LGREEDDLSTERIIGTWTVVEDELLLSMKRDEYKQSAIDSYNEIQQGTPS